MSAHPVAAKAPVRSPKASRASPAPTVHRRAAILYTTQNCRSRACPRRGPRVLRCPNEHHCYDAASRQATGLGSRRDFAMKHRFCGSWLASDSGGECDIAIAGKPAPTKAGHDDTSVVEPRPNVGAVLAREEARENAKSLAAVRRSDKLRSHRDCVQPPHRVDNIAPLRTFPLSPIDRPTKVTRDQLHANLPATHPPPHAPLPPNAACPRTAPVRRG